MIDDSGQESGTRWQRMEEIYDTALSLAATERQAFVTQTCAEEADLQEEVVSMLAADEDMSDFLREPVVELGLMVLASEGLSDTESLSQPTRPAPADLAGTTIGGRYEVIKRLGGGGFGDVYKAVDTKLMSRAVAIKVLKDDVLREEEARRDWLVIKFQQEIEALSKIHDPGVAGIFDADTLPDGRPYIVMEFVEGSDLRCFLKQARQEQVTEQGLQLQDVAEIIKQVGRTLTATHEAEIFHRDLKPENIMLRRNTDGDLQIKIIDFGIAKVRNSLIASSAATDLFVAGTKSYMSPEQLLGKRVEAASDTFALGVIAYEMVTGRCPFAAKDSALLKDLHAAGVKVMPCDLNPGLPAPAQAVILKALSYYPPERHKRARDFGEELARALIANEALVRPVVATPIARKHRTLRKANQIVSSADDEPNRTHLRPASAPVSRTGWHKRWRLAVAAILLVGLAGLAARFYHLLAVPQRPPPPEQKANTESGLEHKLIYWLHVKMPKDNRRQTFDEFDSTGEEAFKHGSKINLHVQPAQAGFLYVINEGAGENGARMWTTVFPNAKDNQGSARLEANQLLRVYEIVLDRNSGDETLHIIWADTPVDELEELFRVPFASHDAVLRNPVQQNMLSDFFQRHSTSPDEIADNETVPRVTLKGRDDLLVGARRLKHRNY